MSTAPQSSAIPQPPAQPEAIRAALAQVAPQLLADFDRDRAASTARARAEVSAIPLRTFTEAWAVEVAIARHPETATRLHALEARAGEVTDLGDARDIAAEISRIRNAAAAEAGLRTAGEASR
ncbi:hypothetical protein OG429_20645 [Streptomyces sp. NBC_00190]|uniref:hypothetical protein n=1 Tax=unclassified Streptomyces TaxID=2593676 RepID=UPI002E284A47|nr:hypothetical protein [Streptomyces sp. NBC_00190]WSZ41473.1 hypothetical protein OG239_23425 [Streptomyces sp. NBC_00868]